MTPTYEEIVEEILALLSGRSGFDDWWDEIDEETKEEIKAEMVERLVEMSI